MKDILISHDDLYIECEINGLNLKYTWSDEPKRHTNGKLRNSSSYKKFKMAVNEMYDHYEKHGDGWAAVNYYLQTYDVMEFFEDGSVVIETDPRNADEIMEYLNEALDKVWLMRTHPCDDHPDIEADRQIAVKRILKTYDDIPDEGYTDWDCGYWNGIMGALRWVLGDDKDFLDT